MPRLEMLLNHSMFKIVTFLGRSRISSGLQVEGHVSILQKAHRQLFGKVTQSLNCDEWLSVSF